MRPEQRRRQGIGSALPAAAAGRPARDAMVLAHNETAHHVWRAAGYSPEERQRRWVQPFTG